MFLKVYLNKLKSDPLFFITAMSVFFLVVMGTSVRHVASSAFAILVLLSITGIKHWKEQFLKLSLLEKAFLLSLFMYMISGALSYYNVDDVDKYVKIFERYFRFLMVVPIYLFLMKRRISVLNYLYAGAVVSGPFLLVVAVTHFYEYPDLPAQGYYHHIIFGQLAMLNVGIMMSVLLTRGLSRKLQLVIVASMLCGIFAAIMSQARGVWLVIPVYVIIAVYYAVKDKKLSIAHIAAFFLIIVSLSILSPTGELIKQRTEAAMNDVSDFYTQDKYISSLGTRLAMWDIAVDIWKRHPVLGTGPGDFDDEVRALQKNNKYVGMDVHNSVHNIYIQALVGAGLVGLVALMAVLLVPIKMFIAKYSVDKGASLAGIVAVVSFMIFGLSESWILRLSIVSVFLVYITVISSHLYLADRMNNETGDV